MKKTMLIIGICMFLLIIFGCSQEEDNLVHTGISYVNFVEETCYNTHNPNNNVTNYAESWGTSYRLCLIHNLNLEELRNK